MWITWTSSPAKSCNRIYSPALPRPFANAGQFGGSDKIAKNEQFQQGAWKADERYWVRGCGIGVDMSQFARAF
jgi:hypothetical protein